MTGPWIGDEIGLTKFLLTFARSFALFIIVNSSSNNLRFRSLYEEATSFSKSIAMRRTSIVKKVPDSRDGSSSTASVAMSTITMDTCFRNADSSAPSFGANAPRSSVSRRSEIYVNRSLSGRTPRVDQNKRGESKSSSFRSSVGGRISVSDSRNSSRFRGTVAASRGAAANPLDSSLRVMSIVTERSNISCCCYIEDENEIMIETFVANGYETQTLVERFLQVARPNLVLLG